MIEFDPEDGTLRIEMPHGEVTTIEGLPPNAPVQHLERRAFFFEREEAETLGKMIDYILKQIARSSLRITPESQQVLENLQPRIRELAETWER